MLAFDWASPIDTSVIEYIEHTGISGNTLTGVIRGQEGYSAKSHGNGAKVVGVVSQAHVKRLRDKLTGNDSVAIQDPNANPILVTSYVASAVNALMTTNAATGNNPTVSPGGSGADANVGLNVTGKGTKGVAIKKLAPYVFTLTDAATITVDASSGNLATVTLAGNRTMAAPTNASEDGQILILRLTQDVTGSRTITWNAIYHFGTSGAPTLTTTASKTDYVAFRYNATASEWDYQGSQLGY